MNTSPDQRNDRNLDDTTLVSHAKAAAGFGFMVFDPLNKDGDAFKLLATLGLDVEFMPENGTVLVHSTVLSHGTKFIASEAIASDQAAALRRAIVRAAAVIYRSNRAA